MAALLHASALAFRVVTYLGVAYLLSLAWSTWRDDSVLAVPAETDATRQDEMYPSAAAWRVVRDGVVVNFLNPKLTIFFVAFLPQFVQAGSPDTTQRMLALGSVFMALTFAVFVVYGVFAAVLRRHLVGRPRFTRRLRRTISVSFVALGLKLAASARV